MINLADLNNNRYSRFELINWWEQEILSNTRILIVGCGALGNEIIKNLAMLGAGNIFAVDMDKVERSNLTRSVLFRTEDEGKPKAETVCRRAREINDAVNIQYYDGNVFELGLGVFKIMDIVICGLDNREARLYVNQSCRKVNIPWIDGAIETLNGVARLFMPGEGACYECTMNEADFRLLNKRKSCLMLGIEDIQQGKIPTTPTISSMIAAVQVQEAVKYLHAKNGKGEGFQLLSGKGFVFNGVTNDSYIVEYQEKEDCPSHISFNDYYQTGIPFEKATLRDVIEIGEKHFGNDKFSVNFNNEVIYALENGEGVRIPFFANMNTVKLSDITVKGELQKIISFHTLRPNSSELRNILKLTLTELKLPLNDILTLYDGKESIHVEFVPCEIVLSVKC